MMDVPAPPPKAAPQLRDPFAKKPPPPGGVLPPPPPPARPLPAGAAAAPYQPPPGYTGPPGGPGFNYKGEKLGINPMLGPIMGGVPTQHHLSGRGVL